MCTSIILLQALQDPQRNGAIFDQARTLIQPSRGFLGSGSRVAWTAARHLPSATPEEALAAMKRASRSGQSFPLCQVIVALPGEPALPTELGEAILDPVLHSLGFDGLQALVLARVGAASPYLQILVHRLHPETREAAPIPRRSSRNHAARVVEQHLASFHRRLN